MSNVTMSIKVRIQIVAYNQILVDVGMMLWFDKIQLIPARPPGRGEELQAGLMGTNG